MELDLNDPNNLTIDNIRLLLASANDESNSQLRVNKNGILYISKVVGNIDTEDLLFRLEIWLAGNSYVGKKASEDTTWVNRVYQAVKSNWPNPSSDFIDFI